jgi:GNAT superfamily N-acetyltransferase
MNESSAILIRNASLADGPAILQLAERFATSFVVEAAAFRASFPRLLVEPSACLLVAEINGSVAGYVLGFEHPTFYANGSVATIEEIMVAETFRRRGIGRKLVDSFSQWARSRQCRVVCLATRRAAPFYLALGFDESATYFRKLL